MFAWFILANYNNKLNLYNNNNNKLNQYNKKLDNKKLNSKINNDIDLFNQITLITVQFYIMV